MREKNPFNVSFCQILLPGITKYYYQVLLGIIARYYQVLLPGITRYYQVLIGIIARYYQVLLLGIIARYYQVSSGITTPFLGQRLFTLDTRVQW